MSVWQRINWLFSEGREHVHGNLVLAWRVYPVGFCSHGSLICSRLIVAAGVPIDTEIPQAAVDVMERIAATGVSVNFFADQLDADPFIWMANHYASAERYYIFAWDEEGYIPR
jgi:hypothetical protein